VQQVLASLPEHYIQHTDHTPQVTSAVMLKAKGKRGWHPRADQPA
jgi:hypothetical protein